MRQLLLVISWLLLTYSALAQANFTATVKDATTQEAIPFANVTLKQGKKVIRSQKSNTSGLVAFQNLDAGNYTVHVAAFGFAVLQQDLLLSATQKAVVSLEMEPSKELLQAVDISGIKANANNPIAFTEMSKEAIGEVNEGRDIPFILEQTPGLVATSDAGAGIGYTSMRIRGSDQTRINVTINGIPVNDGESQGVFWVNMPDLASSLQNIQVQRGLGTSTNGAGAFGASVHMETDALSQEAYGNVDLFAGSFNTLRTSARFGTGTLKNGISIEGRLSRIISDGYVDRASSNLRSYYLAVGKSTEKTSLKFIAFGGYERTYQSWYGIDAATFATNPTFNPAGEIFDANSSGQNVSAGFYPDQVDNYQQNHYQLHLNHKISQRWKLHAAAHYTYGTGYYEEYRNNHSLSNYGLQDIVVDTATTISRSDVTRRLWLRNHFFGGIYNLQYQNKTTNIVIGGGANYYTNDHFGEALWVKEQPELAPFEFYNNVGQKVDINQYVKTTYTFQDIVSVYGDVQMRLVDYKASGIDRNLSNIDVATQLFFLNPKGGVSIKASPSSSFFASVGYGGREPARRDFLEATDEMPRPEFLLDYEAGWRFTKNKFHVEVNAYFMDYFDQLVLTGELSDVGFALRRNVGRSYRTGIEIHGGYLISKKWKLEANAAFSRNRNIDWQEVLFDEDFNEVLVSFGNTNTALSPNIVAGSILTYEPISSLTLAWSNRFVGKQYLTNTNIEELTLPSYWIHDLRFRYQVNENWRISLFVNNIFGNDLFFDWLSAPYASNGFGWSELRNGEPAVHNIGLYPQATTNFLLGVSLNL